MAPAGVVPPSQAVPQGVSMSHSHGADASVETSGEASGPAPAGVTQPTTEAPGVYEGDTMREMGRG